MIPSFYPFGELDLTTEPLTEKWKGSKRHIGPVQTITPLVELLGGKTTCGTLALMSGVMSWGAARLQPFGDASYCDELADAGFAFHSDWRHVNIKGGPRGKSPDQPVVHSAAMDLRAIYAGAVYGETPWNSFYQPLMEASHLVHIVRFILPKEPKKAFDAWLKAVSARLDEIAPIPDLDEPDINDFEDKFAYRAYCAPCRGLPLPPQVLDLSVDMSTIDLAAEAKAHIAQMNPAFNRYLRTPEEMAEMGFEGTAYGA